MVDVKATNEKLVTRSTLIVMEATGCEETTAAQTLSHADGDVKVAIFMVLTGQDPHSAREQLHQAKGIYAAHSRSLSNAEYHQKPTAVVSTLDFYTYKITRTKSVLVVNISSFSVAHCPYGLHTLGIG